MIATDASPVVEIRLNSTERAVCYLPKGATPRVTYPDGSVREWSPAALDDPRGTCWMAAEFVPGEDRGGVWPHTAFIRTGGPLALRNGRHKRDRAVWHEAAKAIRDGGVAYVAHELRDWYGRQVWWAVSVRTEVT